MDAQPTAPDQTPAAPLAGGDDWARPLIDRQLAVLGQLTEAGLELALAIKQQATEPRDAGADPEALSRAFARASRAVRLSVILQSKLIETLQKSEREATSKARMAAAVDAAGRPALKKARRARIDRIVWRLANEAHPERNEADDEAVDRIEHEAGEWLGDEDLHGDILSRPVSETIALICGDLGLSPDWPRLAEEAWAKEEIGSGKVGAPLMEPADEMRPNNNPLTPAQAGAQADDRNRTRPCDFTVPPTFPTPPGSRLSSG